MIRQTSPEIGGMGHSIKRKEYLRFLQGKGNYVDDVNLPDMVYGHMVRSPYAHARLKSVNTEKAKELPGVLAVITGEDLAKSNLAWMPTLFFDKQMALATGKVLFQSQEVAFVVAEDQYTAAGAAELVEVEYEELPVLVDPHKALDPASPVAQTLAALGKVIHYTVSVAAPQADRKSLPVADRVQGDLKLSALKVLPQTFIVVSTQGECDEEALEQALQTDASYVAFVASKAKASKILQYLGERGISAERLNQV